MGTVYEAVDRDSGELVALKRLRSVDAVARARFKREFRAVQDLQHPNLIRLHELFEDEEGLFFTMDLVRGGDFLGPIRTGWPTKPPVSVETTVDTGPDMPTEARSISRASQVGPRGDDAQLRSKLNQLVSAVRALHECGLVHRDIKPSNVLIDRDYVVRVLDFGLVWDIHNESISQHLLGTVAYMAPEQKDHRVGPAADWYAVGVMLYQALTGQLPFRGSPYEILRDKALLDAPSPRDILPGVPEDLDALCGRLLRRDPHDRPTGQQIALALGVEVDPGGENRSLHSLIRLSQGPFVGRADERRSLARCFERAQIESPVVVSIRGESGIGKSELLRRFLEDMQHEPGVTILSGRCYEHEALHYKGFDGVIDSLVLFLRHLVPDEIAQLLPRDVSTLICQFPALRSVEAFAQTWTRDPPPDPYLARSRASEALRELFSCLCARYRVVMSVEDVQWMDRDGRDIVQDLLRLPGAPKLLFVSTSTLPEELPLADSTLADSLLVIRLGPLPSDEALSLARHYARHEGVDPENGDLETIVAESGGHPIFVYELVRHLAMHGASVPTGRVRLDDALWARVLRLDDEARGLLDVLCVAGGPLPAVVVERAAGLQHAALRATAARLRTERCLLTAGVGENTTMQVAHDRIRHVVLDRMPPDRMIECHRAIAEAMTHASPADTEGIATHWSRAGDHAKAAPFAAEAGRVASAKLAFDQASRLFRMAADGVLDLAERHRYLTLLAEALANAGRGREAAGAFLEAASSLPSADSLDLRQRAADQLLRAGYIDHSLEVMSGVFRSVGTSFPSTPFAALASLQCNRAILFVRGLRYRLRPASAVSSGLLRRLDVCLSMAAGLSLVDVVRGADFQARGMLLALRAGEPLRLSRALALEASVLGAEGGIRAVRRVADLLDAADDLAKKVDRPEAQAWVGLQRAIVAMQQGRFEECLRRASQAEAVFDGHCAGMAWEKTIARAFRVFALAFLGRVRDLQELLPRLEHDCQERGDHFGLMSLVVGPAHLSGLAGDEPTEVRRRCEAGLRKWAQTGFHFQHLCGISTMSMVDLYEGRVKLAFDRMESSWPTIERSLLLRVRFFSADMFWQRGLVALAAASRRVETEARAAGVVAEAVQRIARADVAWSAGPALSLRAGLAWLAGDLPSACQLLAQAERAFETYAMRVHAAACVMQRGNLLAANGVDLARQGERSLREGGVVNPQRLARMIIPIAVDRCPGA